MNEARKNGKTGDLTALDICPPCDDSNDSTTISFAGDDAVAAPEII